MELFAGLDVGSRTSDVSVLGSRGQVLAARQVTSDLLGLEDLQQLFAGLGGRVRARVHVAVEDPNTLMAAALVDTGYDVRHTHCVTVARYREALAPSKTKSDRGDSYAMATMLLREPTLHRAVSHCSSDVAGLRVMTRAYASTSKRQRDVRMHLWAHLARYYPQASATFRQLTSTYARASLRAAPTPYAAQHLSVFDLSKQLAAAGRLTKTLSRARRISEGLREPGLTRSPVLQPAYGSATIALLDEWESLERTRQRLAEEALAIATQQPAWRVYASFPALGKITGVALFAEVGDDLQHFATARGLISVAGCAPITRASGLGLVVLQRRAYNRNLNRAARDWVLPLLAHSPDAYELYMRRKQSGDSTGAAQRRVLARWLSALHSA